jgi:hypothetical protein
LKDFRMCHLCDTKALCERLDRQVKNIDRGGAVSLPAIRTLLILANEELTRYRAASRASALILHGVAEVVEVSAGSGEGPVH